METFQAMTDYMETLASVVKPSAKTKLYRKIIVAGDDITFVCNGKLAVPAVKYFLENIGEEKDYSACGGIAFFNSHFPFSDAYQVAEACCENAKKRAKEEENRGEESRIGNFMDFQVCTNVRAANLDAYRDKHYLSEQGLVIARPYFVPTKKNRGAMNEKNEKYSIVHLLCWGDFFHKMPRNKAKDLRNVIPMGKNEREKELSFLESRGYKMLVKEKEEYRIWYDALEIMDLFIGGNAENENND